MAGAVLPLRLAVLLLLVLVAPAAAALPDDPMFAQQWALQRGAPLDGPQSWALAGTGQGSVVAVLDTGIDAGHPDLAGAMWTNPGEVAGNGLDDDRDGFVDDVHGADLVNADGDPADDEGHGTHVAGEIAGAHDGTGIAGLAPGARLMAVKVLDAKRNGSTSDVGKGIRYALAHGATVINVSVNGDAAGTVLTDAVRAASAAGVPIVASAGNDGRDLDLRPSFPASFPSVLAVAGETDRGLLAAFSNFGAGTVDLAAPGESVLSTAPGGVFATRSGTSMAAPWVAATLALMHGVRPDLSGAQLADTVLGTASRPAGLLGVLRAGQLDPPAALRAILDPARIAAAEAAMTPPTLVARVARKARKARKGKRRLLVTWSVAGPTAGIDSFELRAGSRTVAERRATSRGVWIATKARRVRITALDADQQPLATTVLALDRVDR